MIWDVHKASIIGRDHELSQKNKQDFCDCYQDKDILVGVVCDGCGESEYSEVGATLLGKFVMAKLINYGVVATQVLKPDLLSFINIITGNIEYSFSKRVKIVNDCFLSTIHFCLINLELEKLYLGNSGDGTIIFNYMPETIEQDGKPHYLAYETIPDEFLLTERTRLDSLTIQEYDLSGIYSVVIASDGIQPLIEQHKMNELFRTKKRQLQRKFNLWSKKEKLFSDDASCVVFERIDNESNI